MKQLNYKSQIRNIQRKTLRATFSKKYYEISKSYNSFSKKYFLNVLDKKTKQVILFSVNPKNLSQDAFKNKKHFHLFNLPQLYLNKGLVGVSFKWIEE